MPIPQRPRADKYLVLKWDDVHNLLNSRQVSSLIESYNIIHQSRVRNGTARQYVTVSNKDLPLFDEVWGMVLADIQTAREGDMERLRAHMSSQIDRIFRTEGIRRAEDEEDSVEVAVDIEQPFESTGTHVHQMSSARRSSGLSDIENSFTTAWTVSSQRGNARSTQTVTPTSVPVSTPDGTPAIRVGSVEEESVPADGRIVNRSNFPDLWASASNFAHQWRPGVTSRINSDGDQIALFDSEIQPSDVINDNLRFGMAD